MLQSSAIIARMMVFIWAVVFSLTKDTRMADAQFAVCVELGAAQINVRKIPQLVDAGFYIDFPVTDIFQRAFNDCLFICFSLCPNKCFRKSPEWTHVFFASFRHPHIPVGLDHAAVQVAFLVGNLAIGGFTLSISRFNMVLKRCKNAGRMLMS
jgi:hypothetical protein